jgi:hypothetical protein
MAVSTAPTREKRRSSSGRSARKRKRNNGHGWFDRWWPLLLGIAITPFAVHAASIMALAGSEALTSLYPWVLLLKKPAFRLGSDLGETLSQILMYIQFPAYGLVMAFSLRSKSVLFSLCVTVAFHCLGVMAVLLIAGQAS